MSPDVVMYDENFGWGPSFNASHPIGGWEVFQVQLATELAARGLNVWAMNPGRDGPSVEAGVSYFPLSGLKSMLGECRALILGRHSRVPPMVRADRTFTAAVDDPRFCDEKYDHLMGRSTIVCLSEWQAGLYRAKGHEAIVVPSMISDDVYSATATHRARDARGFICVNAWNKGTEATLALWARMKAARPRWKATLRVGSPYSHPSDAEARAKCEAAGAEWIGTLKPREVVEALATAEAVFRVNDRHPETFGVCDAIAEVLGRRVHVLHTGEMGAARDTLVSPYLTRDLKEFEDGVMFPFLDYPPPRDYRVSTIMPRWMAVLGLA